MRGQLHLNLVMAHLLLIHEPRGQRATRTLEEGKAAYAAMRAWGESLHQRGLLIASESLKRDDEAVQVQRREGFTRLTDGPFAEAKEMIGGFFLLATPSREQAVALAAECPAAVFATVEVREVAPCYE